MAWLGIFGVSFAICFAISSGSSCTLEDMARENFPKLSMANNELAFNLYRKLISGTSRNIFFSPLSLSTAFGMLFYGARGETSKELRKALGYEKAELLNDFVHNTFNRYFSDVLQSGDLSNGYVLNSANSILVDKSVELLEKYRHNVQELYRASVRNVDFSKEAPKIVEEINDWVKGKTNGKIEKFVDELSPATALVILNAVYFKGAWKTRFNPRSTRNGIFFNYGLKSETKNVLMMNNIMDFPVAFFDHFKALELPYEGGNVSMLILLPNKLNGLAALENSLTPEKLKKILVELQPFNLDLSLPEFKLEFEEELSGPLKALGANRIFNGADFSGMTPSRGVSVSEVFHKAVIEVNEEGSEAAAVTEIITFKSGPFPFRVNHPFLFAIVEKGSNLILFLGRVNNL